MYYPYAKQNLQLIENIQRVATRILPELKGLSLVFCLNCLLKSRKYYRKRCGKTSGIMTYLIITRVLTYS